MTVMTGPIRTQETAASELLAQRTGEMTVATKGPGFVELTREISDWLARSGANCGLLTVFVRHTSASLTIQENADPDVQVDLAAALERAAPRDGRYVHSTEGPDDMPAHIKSMLTETSLAIPVEGGVPVFGTWQGLYLVEHRDQPHRRRIALHYLGTLEA